MDSIDIRRRRVVIVHPATWHRIEGDWKTYSDRQLGEEVHSLQPPFLNDYGITFTDKNQRRYHIPNQVLAQCIVITESEEGYRPYIEAVVIGGNATKEKLT